MNNMNKLYKCALGLLTTFILSFAGFSNADYLNNLQFLTNVNHTTSTTYSATFSSLGVPDVDGLFCFSINNFGGNNRIIIHYNGYSNMRFRSDGEFSIKLFGCLRYVQGYSDHSVNINNENGGGLTFNVDFYFIPASNYSIVSGNPGYTSLECQTEYSLIPVSEITANYCKLNFDLIDPMECPINEGSGAIVRSNLMINDVPYAQNQNINVFIPDFLTWNIAFNDFNTTIEVEGYNADEEYIENVINKEKLTPTNKDIEDMLTGFMTNYFPYLALAIVFLYLAKKIYKLFK